MSYDVSNDKRRTTVFKTLLDNGDHVQFSVFLCELSRRELAELRGNLIEAINNKQDQVIILDLGAADGELKSVLECVGKPYLPPSRVLVV